MINSGNYVKHATATEAPITQEMVSRFANPTNIRLIHAAMGMVTEAGEFVDMLKKHLFYGKPLDLVNLGEEIGDSLWYSALAVDILQTTLDEVMTVNIDKLKARYPEKFSEFHAENRDLETERKILDRLDSDNLSNGSLPKCQGCESISYCQEQKG